MAKTLSGSARRELIDAVRARYRSSEPTGKRLILQEFTALTGYHRKSAIRVLNGEAGESDTAAPRRPRIYDDAFCRTLVVLWEASDRVCGKRLCALLPVLVPALECNDPPIPAQVMPLACMPQRVFSSPAPDEVAGCCRS
jgi:hypothetical protein